ncbi:MAG: beta-ketoacyl synthase N-terminal-like domain-containing protein [Acidimicrobiales bacterium]
MGSTGAVAAERVAVVGMGCLFPGAPTVDALWSNICQGLDAISDVPPGRWDPVFYDPDRAGVDRFYCRRGGFVDEVARFDPTAFGVMPIAVEGGEPDQFLALAQASAALDDSSSAHRRVPPDKVGVIVGRGGYRTAGLARLDQRVHVAQQLVEALHALMPEVGPGQVDQVRDEFIARLGRRGPEASIGLVPNLAASRIANRFDLQGPAYTVDAACASTLLAVDHALRELHSGRCDLVLAGGAHHCHDVTLWSVFTQLRALSPSQRIRPFSRDADGVLIGEGTGFFVLKRLADAERDDDRIYAVICGSGVASDGRSGSMMRPDVAGQVRALRLAWDAAGLDPATVGMVEAHGTGTPAGDQAELVCLREVFGAVDGSGRPRAGLGSIKSMIGHAMPAAGAAGLAKAVLALHHGVLPPTLHGDDPHPLLDETRFRLIDQAEPWESDHGPRRAGVNAFGFGGIDAHLVLEEHNPRRPVRSPRSVTVPGSGPAFPPTLLVAGADVGEVAARLAAWTAAPSTRPAPSITDPPLGDGPARLAIVDVDARRLQLAEQVVAQGRPWRGRNGVWFEPEGLLRGGGKLAFLFPGVEPTFEPQVDDLAEHFDLVKLAAPLHDPVLAQAPSLERQSRGIIAVGRLLHRALAELDVVPDLVAGHSLGEWSGELATGVIPEDRIDGFLDQLRPGAVQVADVVFLALGTGVDTARALIEGLERTAVSHDNCPHQSVVCGPPDEIETVVDRARARRIMTQELPFRSGFHSPLFAEHIPALRRVFGSLTLDAPSVPLWSATTCRPYPAEPGALRALAARHLVEPVRFRELVLALHDAGARVFLQVGVGNLVGFVDDTLRDRDAVAVAASSAKRSGLDQLGQVAAALWVEGRPVRLDRLAAPGNTTTVRAPVLDLGSRLIRDLTPLAARFQPSDGAVLRTDEGPNAPSTAATPVPAATGAGGAMPVSGLVRTQRLSLELEPAWADHAFFRQRDGWPHGEDRFPLVPMTGIVEMVTATAVELCPDLVPVAVEDVAAFRWLTVDPPTEVTLRATTIEHSPPTDPPGSVRVKATIDGHARATVILAPGYPSGPAPAPLQLHNGQPSHIDATRFYADRHMFHGPAYQGVEEFLTLADNGSRAVLRTPSAPGGLLDNAGQLMGHWLSAQATSSRLVLPTSIGRIELFGPHPAPGTLVDCTVAIDHVDDRVLRADLALVVDDRLWCHITGWQDRRFSTDVRVFETLKWPERSGMSERREGYTIAVERWPEAATRDLVMRRYLGREERVDYDGRNPLAQRQFLLGRIAVKDAVRRWLWDRRQGPLFPAEVVVANDAAGRPLVRGPFDVDLRVSLAHVDEVAVAVVAEDIDVGVDLERVQPRRANFEQLVLTPGEQALRPPGGYDRDTWLTCLWSIKEAVAKATGRGLGGRPRDYEVTEIDGNVARVGDRLVAFERVDMTPTAATAAATPPTAATAAVSAGIAPGDTSKEHIVAWTLTDR